MRIKIATIMLLWITIGLTVIFGVDHLAVRIVLVLIAVAVTIHITMIKTKKSD